MGKGKEWSDSETEQLCISWLETSEDPVRGTGQKKGSFQKRMYNHWLKHKSASDTDDRTETAIGGRWKKLNPEVSKFCGLLKKIKSKERSGWTEDVYVDAAMKIYEERYKQAFEFMAAWKILRNAPKWLAKMAATAQTAAKRSADDTPVERPIGRKAAKDDAQEQRQAKKSNSATGDHHARFAAAAEKKADVMERQLHYNIFMQAPHSDESVEYFQIQRQALLAKIKANTSRPPSRTDEGDESDHESAPDEEEVSAASPTTSAMAVHAIEEDDCCVV